MCLPQEQALEQDLSYLTAAYLGYYDVLRDVFGSKEDEVPQVTKDVRGNPIQLTPNIFDLQFGGSTIKERRRKH